MLAVGPEQAVRRGPLPLMSRAVIGLLPIAASLVQRRDLARRMPELAVVQSLEPAAVALIAVSLNLPPEQATVARFW